MQVLRTLVIAVAALSVCGPARAELPGPAISKVKDEYRLVLPEPMATAIQRIVPGFEPEELDSYEVDIQKLYRFTCRQAPWAVVGDFDGDGAQDLIVEGHAQGRGYRLCVWGATAVVDTLPVRSQRWEKPLRSVLMYAEPGEQYTNFSDDSLFIWADGYVDYFFEKGGWLMYWTEGGWVSWLNSD
jgi:hypothetical protein